MKKIFLSLLLLFFVTLTNAQSYYVATTTELHTFNYENEEWELSQKNSNTTITVVLEEEFLSIHANSPTMYKLYKSSGKSISGKDFEGYRYDALDFKKNEICKIDVIKFSEFSYLISVVKGREYNLRYYIKIKQ